MSGQLFSADLSHVVVIPDVHGDRDAYIRSLWLAHSQVDLEATAFDLFNSTFYNAVSTGVAPAVGLTNRTDVAFVQLGDLIDRGPYGKDCIGVSSMVTAILGWEVVQLFGNHEIMAFLGRGEQYVHARDFSGLMGRNAAYAIGSPLQATMREFFSGVAVLSGPSVDSQVNTLFVHGGVDLNWLKEVAPESSTGLDLIESLNEGIYELTGDAAGLSKLNAADSIMWTRDLAKDTESYVCSRLVDPVLEKFRVARIVLGHTPQEDEYVKVRCGGKIILADAKISRWMAEADVNETVKDGGNPLAIIFEIEEAELDTITVYYGDLGSEFTFGEQLYSRESMEEHSGLDLLQKAAITVSGGAAGFGALLAAAMAADAGSHLRGSVVGESPQKRRRKLEDLDLP